MAPAIAAGATHEIADLDVPVHYARWVGPAGRTFVLVHGLGGSHVNWLPVAPRLAELGTTLAIDLPGSGTTPRGDRPATITANRALLSRFLGDVVGGPAVLVGSSMGGGISLLQTAVDPASVSAVIATASIWPPLWTSPASPAVAGTFLAYGGRLSGDLMMRVRYRLVSPERIVRIGLQMVAADPASIPREVVRAQEISIEQQARDPGSADALLEGARSILHLYRRRERFRRILDAVEASRVPVLVLHGRHDAFVPVANAMRAWADHPSWGLHVFADVGHAPQLEAPERWTERVRGWLDARS
jgi:pimeloyl-ACP methyl ester carboxylesterase